MGTRKQTRVELRAEPIWLKKVKRYAAASRLSLSAYVRHAVQQRMDRDDADRKRLYTGLT